MIEAAANRWGAPATQSPSTDSVGSRGIKSVDAPVTVSNTATGTDAQARTRNARGVPEIPDLDDCGIIAFDDLWDDARSLPMDEACSRLDGIFALIRHNPALAPEITAIGQICNAWWALVPSWESRRLAHFEIALDHARAMPMPTACDCLADMRARFQSTPGLSAEMELIDKIQSAWAALRDNLVSERSQKL